MATVGSLDPSHNLQVNYVISFLFCLDLILHACKILIRCDSFGILNSASKQGVSRARLFRMVHNNSVGVSKKIHHLAWESAHSLTRIQPKA